MRVSILLFLLTLASLLSPAVTIPRYLSVGDSLYYADEIQDSITDFLRMGVPTSPRYVDNYGFCVYHSDSVGIYNNRGELVVNTYTMKRMRVNPANTQIATLEKGVLRVLCYIYDISDAKNLGTILKTLRIRNCDCISMAFSSDARHFALSGADKTIVLYDAVSYKEEARLRSSITPSELTFSPNGLFLAVYNSGGVEIWDLERNNVIKHITGEYGIRQVLFSPNSSEMYVLNAYGFLTVYGTKNYEKKSKIRTLSDARHISVSADGKYVAVLAASNLVCLIDMKKPSEQTRIDAEGKIGTMEVIYDSEKIPFLVYNTQQAIIYQRIYGMKPNYGKLLADEVNERMNDWLKQMPDESPEEYQARVNEESRAEKLIELVTEVATRMGSEVVPFTDVSIAGYNAITKKLLLTSESMPNLLIDVEKEDVEAFKDGKHLEFRNAKYSLTAEDSFVPVYVEIYNPANGKTYIYDRKHETLAYIEENIDFVSLEIVKKTNMEERRLQMMTEDILTQANKEKIITDKTHITVNTKAVSSVNALGKKTVNYVVEFTYEVAPGFSAREDFSSGQYHVEKSGAAMSMLSIMKRALTSEFAKYINEGKRLMISITGTADAAPILQKIKYDGKYGNFEGTPVYQGSKLTGVTLTRGGGITNNNQLAFARAAGVRSHIEKELTGLKKMKPEYEYHIGVSKEKGGQYRRVSVVYTFLDAF